MKTIQAVRLNGVGIYTGTIIHAIPNQEYNIHNPILVFPNGDIKFYETIVFTARKNKGNLAIILEKGGQNCHTLVTMREKQNIIILHLPNALNLLKKDLLVTINSNNGTIIFDD